jgi:hypothetical protein
VEQPLRPCQWAIKNPHLVTWHYLGWFQPDKAGLRIASVSYQPDHRIWNIRQFHAKSNQAIHALGGPYRRQALLIRECMEEEVTWKEWFDPQTACGTPLVRIDRHGQETIEILPLQVLGGDQFLSRLGINCEPLGLHCTQSSGPFLASSGEHDKVCSAIEQTLRIAQSGEFTEIEY